MSSINPRIILLWAWGSAMSAVTRMLYELGYTSLVALDKNQSQLTDQLQDEWVDVIIWHGNIALNQWDVVIASAAATGSLEWKHAQQLYEQDHIKAIPPMLVHEFLWELSKSMQTIAITGTHGKSTTTALIGKLFAELDPNFWLCLLGAWLADWWWYNYHLNTTYTSSIKRLTDRIFSRKAQGVEDIWKQFTFIVEADEYNKHMLYYDPDSTIITTLSHDHVDIYPTQQDYYQAFKAFVLKTSKKVYGLKDDRWFKHLKSLLPSRGLSSIHNVSIQSFNFTHLIGGHNHGNASLVYQLAIDYGLSPKDTKASLESFKSLWRRAETLGKNIQWCEIISDYAHHPSELVSTYDAISEKYPDQPLHIIFQPHQAQRLLEFWDQAVETLQTFTNPIIYQIYAAREDVPALLKQYEFDTTTISDGDSLWEHFASTCWATYIKDPNHIINHINSITDWVIVLFTAGNLDYLVRKSLR